MKMQRRIFLRVAAASGAVLASSASAQATAQPMVGEKEPQALALGYVEDAARVDTKKFPKYASGQICANCSLYQGKPTDPTAGCAIFGTKRVAAKGWCSAWVKRA